MNVALGLLVGLLLVYLIAYTDFVLTRHLKKRIAAINDAGWRGHSHRPLNWPTAGGLALLFWTIPVFLLADRLYLEYKIFLTLAGWALLAAALYAYLRQKTSSRLAGEALPLLLALAAVSGLLLGPLLTALKKVLLSL